MSAPAPHTERPLFARLIHSFAVPIILFWVGVAVAISVLVPSLEEVGQERSVSLSPTDAPSFVAMKRIGHAFKEGKPTVRRWSCWRATSSSATTPTSSTTS